LVVEVKTKLGGGSSLITLALFLAGFATNPPYIAFGLLLVDIAETFQTPVGIMSQINTSASLLGIIAALVMAGLSVKYRYKSLMQIGLVIIAISALGCYFAPSYLTMLIVFSLCGIGTSMVNPMTRSLVGEYFPPNKQAQAIGWLIAGSSVSYLISAPLMAYITNVSNWRIVFLIYILPVSLLSILVSQIFLPKKDESTKSSLNYNILNSFKTVLTDASAMSCLLGVALLYTAYQAILVFSASYYREIFGVDRSLASNLVVVGALMFTIGSVGASNIIDKFGKKKVIVVTSLVGSLFIGLFANIPNFWISILIRFLGGFFIGVSFSSLTAMLLGELPQFRGTIMSLNIATTAFGAMVGTSTGGIIHLSGGYSQVAIYLALFGFLSAIIVYFKTKEK
jgi:DHA1 family inner membrane transport protein